MVLVPAIFGWKRLFFQLTKLSPFQAKTFRWWVFRLWGLLSRIYFGFFGWLFQLAIRFLKVPAKVFVSVQKLAYSIFRVLFDTLIPNFFVKFFQWAVIFWLNWVCY